METTKLTSGNTTTLILFYVWKNEARYFNQTKRKLKKNDLSQEKWGFLTIWWQIIFGWLCSTFVCQYCRRAHMQDSLDQVSNWCDNNHMVISLIKTKSMTIATTQKHQLLPLPLDLILNGGRIDQVSEHRLLGKSIYIDNKLCWDSHTNNVCKTVSRWLFLLVKLRYIIHS